VSNFPNRCAVDLRSTRRPVSSSAGGVAALLGRRQFAAATPLAPGDTIAGVDQDVDAVKAAVREGRTS
jgi:hypothetical protein